MNKLVLLFAMVSLISASQNQQLEWQYENGVVILDDSNFNQAVAEFPVMLVVFYAPWCPHCQKLHPSYNAAAQTLKKHQITLAKVDATVEQGLASRFQIRGFPTMKIFSDDGKQELFYKGGRSAESIISYMLNHVQMNDQSGDGSLASSIGLRNIGPNMIHQARFSTWNTCSINDMDKYINQEN